MANLKTHVGKSFILPHNFLSSFGFHFLPYSLWCHAMILIPLLLLFFGADPIAPSVETIKGSIRLPLDLKIELAASDPLIQSPVAANFDEKGRLWVVEMPDYPNGPKPGQKPGGTIKILEDTNGDGQFDKATVFAKDLLFANGVLPWKNGAFVTAAPHILFLADSDGDGVSDKKELLFEGFVEGNPQLRVSFPVLGPDGWVYVANGLRGGIIKRPRESNAKAINIGGRDFRFHPETLVGEAITGPGQFGNTIGRWGDRFVCDNRHHLRHVVLLDRDIRRNPLILAGELLNDAAGEESGPLSSGGKIYPLSRNWTTSNLHQGRFTAACGVFAYQGQALGSAHHEAIFTCDPTANLIHEEVLQPRGGTFVATSPQKGMEFLATKEEWFRPVSLTSGPDGALYVVDMCRAVIEHPEFMPPELRQRPDLIWGKEKGRIWRVTAKKQTNAPGGSMGQTDNEIVAALGHRDGWRRMTAHRLILQDISNPKWNTLLTPMLQSPSTDARFHALWLLASRKEVDFNSLKQTLLDHDPIVVKAALDCLMNLSDNRLFKEQLSPLAIHKSPTVRFQTALATAGLLPKDKSVLLAEIALRDGADPWTALAIQSSAAGCQASLLLALLQGKSSEPLPVNLCQELARQAGISATDAEISPLAILALKLPDQNIARKILAGLQVGLKSKGKSVATFVGKSDEWADLSARERVRAVNPNETTNARQDSLEIAMVNRPIDTKWLKKLAHLDPDPQMRIIALREASQLPWDQAGPILLDAWKTQPPAVRRERLELLGKSPERILFLLDSVQNGSIAAREVDPARSQQWINHSQSKVNALAKILLTGNLPAARNKVMAEYQGSLDKPGDAQKGKLVFGKNCATCHKVGELGMDVGPDISDTRTKTTAMLLADILNPNLAIDNNYINYIVHLKNGTTKTGMIKATNAVSITLVRAEKQSEVIPQDQIEELQSTGQSLMPDGIEKTVTVAEMTDLLRFLKDWRYLDGKTPKFP